MTFSSLCRRDRRGAASLGTTPGEGDVVIGRESAGGKVVYTLSIIPNADGSVARRCADAVAHAMARAKSRHVRAWMRYSGAHFILLDDFRTRRQPAATRRTRA